jgi:hypothetical protein
MFMSNVLDSHDKLSFHTLFYHTNANPETSDSVSVTKSTVSKEPTTPQPQEKGKDIQTEKEHEKYCFDNGDKVQFYDWEGKFKQYNEDMAKEIEERK